MKLSNLMLDREKIKHEIKVLTTQSERLVNQPIKTHKEVAELSVAMFKKKTELFIVQYQINQLLSLAATIASTATIELNT